MTGNNNTVCSIFFYELDKQGALNAVRTMLNVCVLLASNNSYLKKNEHTVFLK